LSQCNRLGLKATFPKKHFKYARRKIFFYPWYPVSDRALFFGKVPRLHPFALLLRAKSGAILK
jgi:hypothetical protein